VEEFLKAEQVNFVRNTNFEKGLMTSIQMGLNAVLECEAVVLHLADMPLVAPADIEQVVAHWKQTEKGLVRPLYDQQPGHPCLIEQKYFAEILAREPQDKGCKFLFEKYKDDVCEFSRENKSVYLDVDTIGDLKA